MAAPLCILEVSAVIVSVSGRPTPTAAVPFYWSPPPPRRASPPMADTLSFSRSGAAFSHRGSSPSMAVNQYKWSICLRPRAHSTYRRMENRSCSYHGTIRIAERSSYAICLRARHAATCLGNKVKTASGPDGRPTASELPTSMGQHRQICGSSRSTGKLRVSSRILRTDARSRTSPGCRR